MSYPQADEVIDIKFSKLTSDNIKSVRVLLRHPKTGELPPLRHVLNVVLADAKRELLNDEGYRKELLSLIHKDLRGDEDETPEASQG